MPRGDAGKLPKKHPEKHKPKKPRGGVPVADTEARRDMVEALWVEGYSLAEILRIVNERAVAKRQRPWSRATIDRDIAHLREEWEKSARHNPESRKAELERMCRNIYKKALQLEKPITRRTKTKAGGDQIVTEMIAAPDLAAANRAVERMAALRGLNITTLDGALSLGGLAELFGEASDTPEE